MHEICKEIWKSPLIRRPVFLTCMILFVAHQIVEKLINIQFEWADNYLDMLVLMPILLTLYSLEKRYFDRSNEKIVTELEIFILTLIVGLITELLFPYLSSRFTYDAKDFLFLSFGSVAFYTERLSYNKINVK